MNYKHIVQWLSIILVISLVCSPIFAIKEEADINSLKAEKLPFNNLVLEKRSMKDVMNIGSKIRDEFKTEEKVRTIIKLKDPAEVIEWKNTIRSMSTKEKKNLKEDIRNFVKDNIQQNKHTFTSFNGFSAKITQEELNTLAQLDMIESIEYDQPVQAFLSDSTIIINATETWKLQSDGDNLTGLGQSVCVIDTGVDYTHPDLGGCNIKSVQISGTQEEYTLDSEHNYQDNTWYIYNITKTGYSSIAVHFSEISMEGPFDYIYIIDSNMNIIQNYTGHYTDIWSPHVSGDTIRIALDSDESENDWGFNINKVINGTADTQYDWSDCQKVITGYDVTSLHEDPMDDEGHGTHCAGIVAANGDTTGVAPDATIVAVKALDRYGSGYNSNIIKGIEYCTNISEEYNISVISLSLGGGGYDNYCDSSNSGMSNAINAATSKNISVIIASGNYYTTYPNGIASPACIQNATPVGATTKEDIITSYSQRNSMVDLFAPGSYINSLCLSSGNCIKSGTSMATPHVAGAYAIVNQYLKSKDVSKSPSWIENMFNNNGETISDASSGLDYTRINVYDTINFIATLYNDGFSNIGPYNITLALNDTAIDLNYQSIMISGSAEDDTGFSNATTMITYPNNTIESQTNCINTTSNCSFSFATTINNGQKGNYSVKTVWTDTEGAITNSTEEVFFGRGTAIVNTQTLPTGTIVIEAFNGSNTFIANATFTNIGDSGVYDARINITIPHGWTSNISNNTTYCGDVWNTCNASFFITIPENETSQTYPIWMTFKFFNPDLTIAYISESFDVQIAPNRETTILNESFTKDAPRNIADSIRGKFTIKNVGNANATDFVFNYTSGNIPQGWLSFTEEFIDENTLKSNQIGNITISTTIPKDIDVGTYSSMIDMYSDQVYRDSINITLTLSNSAPNITAYTPEDTQITIAEPENQTFSIDYFDDDSVSIVWSIDDATTGTNNTEYLFRGNYTAAGTYVINATVSDQEFRTEHTWTLTVTETHEPLTWKHDINNITTQEDDELIFDFNTTRESEVNFSTNLSGASVDNNGILNFTPEVNFVGDIDTYISATDGDEVLNAALTISVTQQNDAPEFTADYDDEYSESDIINITINATDIDNETLLYNIDPEDKFSLINTTFTWETDYQDSGVHTITVNVSDGISDTLESFNITINDVYDADNDGINDTDDYLQGDVDDIDSDENLSIEINGSTDTDNQFNGTYNITILDKNKNLIEFNWTFSNNNRLNTSKLIINKQAANSGHGYVMVNGLDLGEGQFKTIYVDRKNTNKYTICIKDAEIDHINNVSSKCTEDDETSIRCPNATGNYNCTISDDDTQFKITGLSHSAIVEQSYCGDETRDSGEYCDGTEFNETCISQGYDAGQLKCNDDCTISTRDCIRYYSSVSGGGGGGGGVGGTIIPSSTKGLGIKYSKFYTVLPIGITRVDVNKIGIAVQAVKVNMKEQNRMVNFVVQIVNDSSILSNPPRNAYQYLKIDPQNMLQTSLIGATIEFSIPNTWITEFNKNNVYLQRYTDEKWEKNVATLLDDRAGLYTYEVSIKGFSYFAITAETPVIVKATQAPILEEPTEIKGQTKDLPDIKIETVQEPEIKDTEEVKEIKENGWFKSTWIKTRDFLLRNILISLMIIIVIVLLAGSSFNMYYYLKNYRK